MAIDVNSADGIPPDVVERLKPLQARLQQSALLESLYEDAVVRSVVRELNQRCVDEGVIGFHCTRAHKSSIEERGLLVLSGRDRRELFLEDYAHLFTSAQVASIRSAWTEYFDVHQSRARDGRVWFFLTKATLAKGGVDRPLRFFGGEMIFMPLAGIPGVQEVLRSIGEPLVVTCEIDLLNARKFHFDEWGKVWLSTYHRTLNRSAGTLDIDAYVERSVPPERIVAISSAFDFGWKG